MSSDTHSCSANGSLIKAGNRDTELFVHVRSSVKHQRRKTQKALLRLQSQRQCKLVPDLLLPQGWQPVTLDKSCVFYKVVAAVSGGLKSIYDGCTQYKLGQPLQARRGGAAWPPLDACYFAYPSMQQAASANFPKGSRLASAPKLLIQIQCQGRSYHHESGMWALSHIKPIEVVSQITAAPEVIISPRHRDL